MYAGYYKDTMCPVIGTAHEEQQKRNAERLADFLLDIFGLTATAFALVAIFAALIFLPGVRNGESDGRAFGGNRETAAYTQEAIMEWQDGGVMLAGD